MDWCGDWYVASFGAATDHEEGVVGFAARCLLGGVPSEPVCRVDVRFILRVLFDDP